MIGLSAKIKLVNGKKLDGVSVNYGNTLTSSTIESITNKVSPTSNALFLGITPIDYSHQMKNKVDYFVGNKNIQYGYLIKFNTPIDSVNIIFDNTNGGHPKLIYINYNENNGEYIPFYVNSTFVKIANLGVEISNIYIHNYIWNIEGSPVIIEGIFGGIEKEYNINNILEANYNIYDRQKNTKISFGLISNDGNITIIDDDHNIGVLSEFNALDSGLPIELTLKNSLTDKKEKIGSFYTKSFQYKNFDRKCNIAFDDGLTYLQNTIVEPINYDILNPKSMSAKEFIEYLWEQKYIDIPKENIDEETNNYLSSVNIPYLYLEKGTAWSTLNKVCDLCQLHIFKNRNGNLVIKYNGGN